ncbi:hypothetical protein BBBOND_0107290 [Babesia bigemina]|uniref:Uncharacterized protein n=1 Tax=Babesia bigemina TaxID=5866 RepID=A0A061D9L8_BABBI|nr:hypothetical protein BBBOND_0107290 [Babesia bigemina]CDR94420.1 hypothetical protein BBBOND_0107290 [Babesia bigemina]|eukprot:XP_012766606.1 hypothetical protein BBBOND_0107290 [Babesia bigemina]
MEQVIIDTAKHAEDITKCVKHSAENLDRMIHFAPPLKSTIQNVTKTTIRVKTWNIDQTTRLVQAVRMVQRIFRLKKTIILRVKEACK